MFNYNKIVENIVVQSHIISRHTYNNTVVVSIQFPIQGNELFSFSRSGNNTKRNVEFRHSEYNVLESCVVVVS